MGSRWAICSHLGAFVAKRCLPRPTLLGKCLRVGTVVGYKLLNVFETERRSVTDTCNADGDGQEQEPLAAVRKGAGLENIVPSKLES